MSEVILTDKNFEKEVLKDDGTVLVDFWAPWCGPCKMMDPVVEEVAKEFKGKAKIAKLNTDENQNTSSKYGVMSIPTIIIFQKGEIRETLMGVQPKGLLSDKLNKLL